MKFVLEIELGNDEMRTKTQLSEALSSIASRVRVTSLKLEKVEGGIRDLNGNTVGTFRVEE